MGGGNIAERSSATFLLSIAGDSLPFSYFGGMGVYPHNRFSDYFKKEAKSGGSGVCRNASTDAFRMMCIIKLYTLKAIFTLSKIKIKNKGFCLIL